MLYNISQPSRWGAFLQKPAHRVREYEHTWAEHAELNKQFAVLTEKGLLFLSSLARFQALQPVASRYDDALEKCLEKQPLQVCWFNHMLPGTAAGLALRWAHHEQNSVLASSLCTECAGHMTNWCVLLHAFHILAVSIGVVWKPSAISFSDLAIILALSCPHSVKKVGNKRLHTVIRWKKS